MKWHEHLYVGPEAEKKQKKLMKKLDSRQLVLGAYVIMLASNGKDLLDVIPATMLFREQTAERTVIGLAFTKDEALELCETILLDVFEQTGSYDVRSFFA